MFDERDGRAVVNLDMDVSIYYGRVN